MNLFFKTTDKTFMRFFFIILIVLICYSCSRSNSTLPFKVTHYSNAYNEFALIDEEGYELIGKGFSYQGSKYLIEEVNEYAYNDTSIIVSCVDTSGQNFFLKSYVTNYVSGFGNETISFEDISDIEYHQLVKAYTLVKI